MLFPSADCRKRTPTRCPPTERDVPRGCRVFRCSHIRPWSVWTRIPLCPFHQCPIGVDSNSDDPTSGRAGHRGNTSGDAQNLRLFVIHQFIANQPRHSNIECRCALHRREQCPPAIPSPSMLPLPQAHWPRRGPPSSRSPRRCSSWRCASGGAHIGRCAD